MYYKTLVTK